MSDVLESLGVLQMVRHDTVLWRSMRVAWNGILIFVVVFVVSVLLAHEVLGALVLVCAAILRDLSAHIHLAQLCGPGRWVHTYW
jgi:hypothetical protein